MSDFTAVGNRRDNRAQVPNTELTEKQQIVLRLRQQNETLKQEMKLLSSKLDQFVAKAKLKKMNEMKKNQQQSQQSNVSMKIWSNAQLSSDPQIQEKEKELRESQAKIQYYKKETENMRRQLEESYNIQKITQLEDEQKNKQRILKQLQDENRSLVKVQQDQEKALQSLSKENDYEKKIHDLNSELKQAKDHLRRLQLKQREDERSMKVQHETLIMLEEKCRKMAIVIKEKKKRKAEIAQKDKIDQLNKQQVFTKGDLEQLENEVRLAEQEKLEEEKKLKEQIKSQEAQMKLLQDELQTVSQQVKEKDQEYRLNELKIKELRRQLPARILRPIDQKYGQGQVKRLGVSSQSPASRVPRNNSLNQLTPYANQGGGVGQKKLSVGQYNSAKALPKLPKPTRRNEPNEDLNSLTQLKKLRDSNSHVVIANSHEGARGPTAAADVTTPALTPVLEGTLKTVDSQDQAEVPLPGIAQRDEGMLVKEYQLPADDY